MSVNPASSRHTFFIIEPKVTSELSTYVSVCAAIFVKRCTKTLGCMCISNHILKWNLPKRGASYGVFWLANLSKLLQKEMCDNKIGQKNDHKSTDKFIYITQGGHVIMRQWDIRFPLLKQYILVRKRNTVICNSWKARKSQYDFIMGNKNSQDPVRFKRSTYHLLFIQK